jgi:hypothetical protein
MSVVINLQSSPLTHSVRRRWLGTRSYWGFQTMGWGAILAVEFAPLLFATAQITVQAVAANLAFVGLCALGSHLLRVVLLFLLQRSRGAAGLLVMCAAWTFVIGAALTFVYMALVEHLAGIDPTIPKETPVVWSAADYTDTLVIVLVLLMVWIGFYVSVRSYRQQQQDKLDQVRSEVQAREAELRALKAQINPHFLFNSLNSLRALMPPEQERSRATVSRLANLLRASLATDQEPLVPLSRELSMVEGYLEIEKLRHEERLHWKIDASPAARDWPVPPFALQSLVENAIKHGINRIEEGGEIEISAQVAEARLHLEVTNPGSLESTPNACGVGLANVRTRLYLLFGPEASLDLIVPAPGRVQARVRLPAPLAPMLTEPLPSS